MLLSCISQCFILSDYYETIGIFSSCNFWVFSVHRQTQKSECMEHYQILRSDIKGLWRSVYDERLEIILSISISSLEKTYYCWPFWMNKIYHSTYREQFNLSTNSTCVFTKWLLNYCHHFLGVSHEMATTSRTIQSEITKLQNDK